MVSAGNRVSRERAVSQANSSNDGLLLVVSRFLFGRPLEPARAGIMIRILDTSEFVPKISIERWRFSQRYRYGDVVLKLVISTGGLFNLIL